MKQLYCSIVDGVQVVEEVYTDEIETLEETLDIILKAVGSKEERNGLNKKLYYVIVKSNYDRIVVSLYVVSSSTSEAEEKVKEFLRHSSHSVGNYISRIDVLAEEGEYGLPAPLIV